MKFKHFVNAKNIIVWISALAFVIFSIYLLAASWTVPLTIKHGGVTTTYKLVLPALGLAMGKEIPLSNEAFVEGTTIGLVGEAAKSNPVGFLYLVGPLVIILGALGTAGLTFLSKKFKGRKFLGLLCVILIIAGIVLWYLGEVGVFSWFNTDADGSFKDNGFVKTVLPYILSHGKEGYVVEFDAAQPFTPVKYFLNRPFFWIILMIGFGALLVSKFVGAHKSDDAPEADSAKK